MAAIPYAFLCASVPLWLHFMIQGVSDRSMELSRAFGVILN